MSTSELERRRFQFSLRSLLVFTVFVAVLCSIGVCTFWSVSAVIAAGGGAGRIISGTWLGLVLGVVLGGLCAALAVVVSALLEVLLFGSPMNWASDWPFAVATLIAAIVGSVIGGVLGGRVARFRSEQ